MTTDKLAAVPPFEPVVLAESREITEVYCADLLSWAMGRAPEGCCWCTVMGNVNAVAVASLADVAAIVLCDGAALDAEAEAKARQQGVNILRCALPVFEAGLAAARAAGLYGL
ncbi:hypothetical protein LJC60_09665 [Ruminococcaceae bacterium OttesenSCG-928-D13]|nr:hypothetical protein [Ruminococcaceae bacterium OttesenSCG-928-D13]